MNELCLKDGKTLRVPTQVTVSGVRISNPAEEHLAAAGYLPYVEPKPAELTPEQIAAQQAEEAKIAAEAERTRPALAVELAPFGSFRPLPTGRTSRG